MSAACRRPLVVRCGALGDMVLVTALIRDLSVRHACAVDIVTSGPWSEPLLRGQPGVGDIMSVRSRKAPYCLSLDQQRVVRRLRERGIGPTWFCDGNDAARPMLRRAGIPEALIVDARDTPLRPGEHATQQWRRLARIDPVGVRGADAAPGEVARGGVVTAAAETARGGAVRSEVAAAETAGGRVVRGEAAAAAEPARGGVVRGEVAAAGGCQLYVSDAQRADLESWLRARQLQSTLIVAVQVGNKRTMRRGLRRLAVNSKYWPNDRWAMVLRHVRQRCPSHAIVLLGTPAEQRLNQQVAALAGVDRVYNVADDLPVSRLVALLERADALITVDSGPAHVAAAVGCPQVVLFGKASTSLYRPWGTAGADVKVLTGRVAGLADMLGIETADVTTAWDSLQRRDSVGKALATCPE